MSNRPAFKKYLQKKISENIEEYRKGRWVSPSQAVAVSYSQARRKFGIRDTRRSKRKSRQKRNKK